MYAYCMPGWPCSASQYSMPQKAATMASGTMMCQTIGSCQMALMMFGNIALLFFWLTINTISENKHSDLTGLQVLSLI